MVGASNKSTVPVGITLTTKQRADLDQLARVRNETAGSLIREAVCAAVDAGGIPRYQLPEDSTTTGRVTYRAPVDLVWRVDEIRGALAFATWVRGAVLAMLYPMVGSDA